MTNIVHLTLEIITTCKQIKKELTDYLILSDERPHIDKELLTIIMNAEQLGQYIEPGPQAKQLVNQSDWDFNPWFGEKTDNIRNGIVNFYVLFQKKPEEISLLEDIPLSQKEWLKEGLEAYLHLVQHNAESVFQLTCGDKLVIKNKY